MKDMARQAIMAGIPTYLIDSERVLKSRGIPEKTYFVCPRFFVFCSRRHKRSLSDSPVGNQNRQDLRRSANPGGLVAEMLD